METRASDRFNSLMNDDPAKLSLSNFLAGESDDPLEAPASFTNWMRAGAWAVQLYEPELLASADARTVISYGGKPQPVINLCSYNYLGLNGHPEVVAAITTVRPEYLRVSLDGIATDYGSLDAYLLACGLDGRGREALRRRLLQP